MKIKFTPQQQGRLFEVEWAKRVGGTTVPGSGAVWHSKLDVADRMIRWSCKLTTAESYRLTQAELQETFDATSGSGGDGSIPAMAIRIGDPRYDVVVIPAVDFIALMTGERAYIVPSKAEQKRARASQPILLREED